VFESDAHIQAFRQRLGARNRALHRCVRVHGVGPGAVMRSERRAVCSTTTPPPPGGPATPRRPPGVCGSSR
jgi:hypothetical protein